MEPLTIGIICALIAMICWGFGDFFIQRSTRKFGDWETLFLICLFGALIQWPFIIKELPSLADPYLLGILALASVVILFAALFEFEGFRQGKLSVIEPLLSLEIPITMLLAFVMLGEVLSGFQYLLIVGLLGGLLLVSLKKAHFSRQVWLEKGVFIGACGALIMGAANFGIGFGARETSPFMVNWFTDVMLAGIAYSKLRWHGKHKAMWQNCWKYKHFLGKMCVLDNAAWIAFAYAMVLAPIGIAVALSESYILIGVLLGVYVNKERLYMHQKIGLILALGAAIWLATSV